MYVQTWIKKLSINYISSWETKLKYFKGMFKTDHKYGLPLQYIMIDQQGYKVKLINSETWITEGCGY